MPCYYSEAPEVQEIADKLIEDIHTGLKEARVKCIFTSKETKRKNKIVMATARKVTGLTAYLAEKDEEEFELTGDPETDEFFVIIVDCHVWYGLTDAQKLALVDHELCHCCIKEKVTKHGDIELKLSIVPHDLEEFNDVVRRHGLWKEDVEAFINSGRGKSTPPKQENTAEIIEMTSQVKRFNDELIGRFSNPNIEQDNKALEAVLSTILDEGSKIGPVTAGRLATHFHIETGNAVYLVSLLERHELLTKPDGMNNRYVIQKPKGKRKQS